MEERVRARECVYSWGLSEPQLSHVHVYKRRQTEPQNKKTKRQKKILQEANQAGMILVLFPAETTGPN